MIHSLARLRLSQLLLRQRMERPHEHPKNCANYKLIVTTLHGLKMLKPTPFATAVRRSLTRKQCKTSTPIGTTLLTSWLMPIGKLDDTPFVKHARKQSVRPATLQKPFATLLLLDTISRRAPLTVPRRTPIAPNKRATGHLKEIRMEPLRKTFPTRIFIRPRV